jgi:hypothetical protein
MPSCHACIKSKNWKSFRPLSLEYTSDTDEGGWMYWMTQHLKSITFRRMELFYFSDSGGDKRKRRNLKWKGLGFFFFQCVLVSKKKYQGGVVVTPIFSSLCRHDGLRRMKSNDWWKSNVYKKHSVKELSRVRATFKVRFRYRILLTDTFFG